VPRPWQVMHSWCGCGFCCFSLARCLPTGYLLLLRDREHALPLAGDALLLRLRCCCCFSLDHCLPTGDLLLLRDSERALPLAGDALLLRLRLLLLALPRRSCPPLRSSPYSAAAAAPLRPRCSSSSY
jgi:hypothetical protein